MSGITVKNFAPYETIPLLCVANNSVSAKFALPGSWACPDVMISNNGTTIAFFGLFSAQANPVLATTATAPALTGTIFATPILPGETMVISKDEYAQGADTVAAFSTGTPQLYFTAGIGS